jgi:hypothetical protein
MWFQHVIATSRDGLCTFPYGFMRRLERVVESCGLRPEGDIREEIMAQRDKTSGRK